MRVGAAKRCRGAGTLKRGLNLALKGAGDSAVISFNSGSGTKARLPALKRLRGNKNCRNVSQKLGLKREAEEQRW